MIVSYQLYSSREFGPWPSVIEELARLGYGAVEGFVGVYGDPVAIRDSLDVHGLSMPSGHFPIEALREDFDGMAETARILGIERIYAPSLAEAERPADADGWRAFGAGLERLGSKARAAGFRFGWHNHAFEFEPLADGSIPMAHILDAAPSIEWQADLAWIARGGGDPLAWIEARGDRIAAAHVKDIAPEGERLDEDGWADVGEGVMDWRALLAALARHADRPQLVIEHDKPRDAFRFASRSLDNLRAIAGARS